MSTWHIKHGKWWMVQRCFDWWFSFGLHVDFKQRVTGKTANLPKEHQRCYGPYLDLHVLWFIISIGYQPYYSIGEEGYR